MTYHVSNDCPGGNAIILETHNEGAEPQIHLAAAPTGGPEAVWFHLEIDPGDTPAATMRCVLRFYENLLGNRPGHGSTGFRPVFRTTKRGWARVPEVERVIRPDGQLWVQWRVPANEGRIRVALSYPYGSGELGRLQQELGPRWTSDGIGVTEEGRLLERLSNRYGASDGTENGVYCLARQHAAEVPGSWVLDGFLRRMDKAGPEAPMVWAVPFADSDGVEKGWAGKDRFPFDFNRSWGSKLYPTELQPVTGTHPLRHEIKCMQNDLLRWRERCKPRLVLDFHAPTVSSAAGIYCYLRDVDETGRVDMAHRPWTDAFETALDRTMRAEKFVRSSQYPGRWNTARIGDYVNKVLELPQVTLEIPYGCSGEIAFTREDYQNAGARIAEGVMHVLAGEFSSPPNEPLSTHPDLR